MAVEMGGLDRPAFLQQTRLQQLQTLHAALKRDQREMMQERRDKREQINASVTLQKRSLDMLTAQRDQVADQARGAERDQQRDIDDQQRDAQHDPRADQRGAEPAPRQDREAELG